MDSGPSCRGVSDLYLFRFFTGEFDLFQNHLKWWWNCANKDCANKDPEQGYVDRGHKHVRHHCVGLGQRFRLDYVILYLYYIILHHIISCYIMLHHMHHIASYYIILHHIASYYIILYYIILHHITSCYIMLHHIASYYTHHI